MKLPGLEEGIGGRQISILLQSLSMLLRCGVALDRSLEILAEQEHNGRLRRMLRGLLVTVSEDGEPMSTACAAYPRVFQPSLLALIRIGEVAGDLPGRLSQCGRLLERQERMADDIRHALVSPCLTLLTCIAMTYAIVGFVIPRLQQLYTDMRVDMPLLSRLVLGGVAWLCHPAIVAATVAALLGAALRRQHLATWLLSRGLAWPATRRLIGQCLATSFCSTVGQLYQEGIGLTVAVELVVDSIRLPPYQQALQRVYERFQANGDLAAALAAVPFFPPTVASMMHIGQETGQIDKMLLALARILEEETQDLFNRLLALLEPFLMVTFGVVLAVLFVSLFLPIYGLLSHIQL